MTTWTGHEVVDNENHVPVRPPDSELSKILDSIPDTDRPVRRTADGSMRTVAYQMIMDNPDVSDDELRTAILDRFGQDSKANSVWKSIKRARTDSERAS
jgi:predicted SnoaL-like aldol condensation-catalyzing enzyme